MTGRKKGWILNLQFPSSLAEVERFAACHGCAWNADLIARSAHDGNWVGNIGWWSAPAWAEAGDPVFFMSAKSSKGRMRKISREAAKANGGQGDPLVMGALSIAESLYARHGGAVFAAGRCVSSGIELFSGATKRGSCFAQVGYVRILGMPVDVLAMDPFVRINRFGGITKVEGEACEVLCAECNL